MFEQLIEKPGPARPGTSDEMADFVFWLDKFQRGVIWVNDNWQRRRSGYISGKIQAFEVVIMKKLDRSALNLSEEERKKVLK